MMKGIIAALIALAAVVAGAIYLTDYIDETEEVGNFVVEDLDIDPDYADVDESVELCVNIKNIGEGTGDRELLVLFDNQLENSQDLELESDASENFCFRVSKGEGSYEVTVDVEDDDVSGTLFVENFAGPSMDRVSEIKETVEDWRGLDYTEEFSVRYLDSEDAEEKRERVFENDFSENELEAADRTFKAFGVLDEDESLENLVRNFSINVPGWYDYLDYFEEDVYFNSSVAEEQIEADPTADRKAVWESSVVHEITHALQDQRYNLEEFYDSENFEFYGTDSLLAREAIVEGEADYMQSDYFVNHVRGIRLEGIHEQAQDGLWEMVTDPSRGETELPLFLEKIYMFPYSGGARFIISLLERGGWTMVDEAYADPPETTQQILYPEKYLDGELEYYRLIKPDLRDCLGDGWELLENDMLGEYGIYALFLDHFDGPGEVQQNLEASTGWKGDSFATYYSDEEDTTNLFWLTKWNNTDNARLFFERYSDLLGRKYPKVELTEGENSIKGQIDDEVIWIEKMEEKVLVIESVSESSIEKLRSEILESTKEIER